jgi:predicted RNA binding protein YcfA (HicA-like mRNA interferase family)
MPSKAEKILERRRRSKTGWRLADFYTLFSGFGFTITSGRSHDIIKHPEFSELRYTLPRHPSDELAKVYAADAVKLIDHLLQLRHEKDQADE